jgi:hypothetical protein
MLTPILSEGESDVDMNIVDDTPQASARELNQIKGPILASNQLFLCQ